MGQGRTALIHGLPESSRTNIPVRWGDVEERKGYAQAGHANAIVQSSSDHIAARYFCSQEGKVEFKDETVEVRQMDGAEHDVCSRCREMAGSQVTVTLAPVYAEAFPNPTEAAEWDGGAASDPFPVLGCTHSRLATRRGLWLHLAKLMD